MRLTNPGSFFFVLAPGKIIMLKKNLLTGIAVMCMHVMHAQPNVIPNGNFEQYTQCPGTTSQVDRCTGWRQYNVSTSDYMNACHTGTIVDVPVNTFGFQYAASGDGYMGGYVFIDNPSLINLQYKEHIAIQIPPLVKGKVYEFSMSVSLADKSSFASDDLGVLFYDNGPTTPDTGYSLQTTPQINFKGFGVITDTAKWTRVSGTIYADSAYDNIVIGSFSPYGALNVVPVTPAIPMLSKYCYYYFDSVVLKLVSKFSIDYTDTLVCGGDTIQVPYTVLNNGYFNPGNIFTLQLSDATGSFANPLNLASVSSTASGIITAYLPGTLPVGNGYKLRLVSSNTADTTVPTSQDIHINAIKPMLTASITSPVCTGEDFTLDVVSIPPAEDYTWSGPVMSGEKGKTITVSHAQPGHEGRYVVKAQNGNCISYDSVELVVKPTPDLRIEHNSPVCLGDTLQLEAVSNPDSVSFTWSGPGGFTGTTPKISIEDAGTGDRGKYTVVAQRGDCKSESSVDMDVFDPQPEIGLRDTLCEGETMQLVADIPYSSIAWQDGSQETTYTVRGPGTYWVSAASKCGVMADTLQVTTEGCDCQVFVPTAFTPNNDGLNDKVGPLMQCWVRSDYLFLIVNRFGEAVFKSDVPGEKWDGMYKGQPAELGTYFYLVQLKGGKNSRQFQFKGDVTLIR